MASKNGYIVPSRFADSKVIVSSANLQIDPASGKTTLKHGTALLAEINLNCASHFCSAKDFQNSVSCLSVAKGVHPNLVGTYQVFKLDLPDSISSLEDLKSYSQKDPADQACLVGIAEQRTYQSSYAFNDPDYSLQQPELAFSNFEAGAAAFAKAKLAKVNVGVIDSGVSTNNDLSDVVSRESYTTALASQHSPHPLFQNDDPNLPNNPHGTMVAGIIGAIQNNGDTITGVASNVAIYSYGVGDSTGAITTDEIANAINAAVAEHMDVVNMSLGGAIGDDPLVSEALIYGFNSGVLFVAAAGNLHQDLDTSPSYPAQYSVNLENVITVAASDTFGNLANYSNYSSSVVNIMAPGTHMTSVLAKNLAPNGADGQSITNDGTSFAAPMVTGSAALVIGFLKAQGSSLNLGSIRNLITVTGANLRPDLTGVIKNGAFLDFNLLYLQLQQQGATNAIAANETLTQDASGNPTVTVGITWNSKTLVPAPNSSLGIFDLTDGCNYSSACAIQNISWPPAGAVCDGSGNCSYTFVLPRDQVISMMSSQTDPGASLPLSVAVYHAVQNPGTNPPTYKNVYGVDAYSNLDLRSLSNNTGQGVMGVVSDIRMDMQNFYVKGWACLPASEAAVPIKLINTSGTAIATGYGYVYPYMVPHGSPIDWFDLEWMTNLGPNQTFAQYPHNTAFLATGISLGQRGQTQYLAGLEGDPQLVYKCNVLTTSHGFEFSVPLATITAGALNNQPFQVIAGTGSNTLVVPSVDGTTSFSFPDVTSAASSSKIQVQRDAQNYTFTGNLCTTSPNPVEVEVSFTSYDFVFSLTGHVPYPGGGDAGFVYDKNLTPTGPLPLPIETVSNKSSSDMTLTTNVVSLTATDTDPFTLAYLSYTSAPPNAAIFGPGLGSGIPDGLLQQFVANINSYKTFTQIGTGAPLTFYRRQQDIAAGPGSSNIFTQQTNQLGYADAQMLGLWTYQHWDYYDVGTPFSTELIGYDLSTQYAEIAAYMKNTYNVSFGLREVKKYETPLGINTQVVGHGKMSVNWSGSCTSGFEQDFSNLAINYSTLSPYYVNNYSGFWLNGQSPSLQNAGTIAAAMQKVPLTLRFFQDGRLILHLESDSNSTFYPVNYGF